MVPTGSGRCIYVSEDEHNAHVPDPITVKRYHIIIREELERIPQLMQLSGILLG